MKEKLCVFFSNFFRHETRARAFRVAIIVAPILIIINHHDALMGFKFTSVLVYKSLLTFLVPYCVSAYSSARAYSEKEIQ